VYSSAPALLPVFRSEAQARILAALLLDPSREASIADLAGLAGIRPPNALREVNRLIGAGLLKDRRVGRTRLVSADVSSPYHQPLVQILARSFGPVLVIGDELAAVPGIDKALIFGSWAARFLGQAGPPPGDVDVLVIGAPPGRDLRRANARMEDALHIPVQITTVPAHEWAAAESGFLRDVQTKPSITLDLTESREHR
jgi:predicted nucleotidyltransferase/DNA-binding transcriptional ArsR family regulator